MSGDFHISKEVGLSFGEAVKKATDELAKEGFGIMSEINVQEKLKAKLDVDIPSYLILGACNPALAHQALNEDAHVGVLMPCNVVVREIEAGRVEISAMNPSLIGSITGSDALSGIAQEGYERIQRVMAAI